ncbi:MAG: corrinoid protein [SAR202 cluster bacterium]|nr:corrinoid protein [SAR202 cluster bacterium]
MDFQELARYVVDGEADASDQWTQAALDNGIGPLEIMDKGLIPGMNVVGQRFRDGQYFIPEVLISARAMNACLKLIRPLIIGQKVASRGEVVIGTVKGDVHDIGKNIVVMMLEGAGFTIHDLGVDVTPEKFVEAVDEHKPQVVALSAMLTTTMTWMKNVIEALDEAELRQSVKVVVGGAPVTEDFAHLIKADGYADDGISATDEVKNLLGLE